MQDTLFFGNTITQWLITLGLIVFSFVAGKIVYWIFNYCLSYLTRKTETKLDDIIIDLLEEPIVFAVTITGIYFSIDMLNLPHQIFNWPYFAIQFLIALTVAWYVVRLYEALHLEYLVPLVEKTVTFVDDQLLQMLRIGVRFFSWTAAIFVGLNNASYDIGSLAVGLIVGGVVFGITSPKTIIKTYHQIIDSIKKAREVRESKGIKIVRNITTILCLVSLMVAIVLIYNFNSYQQRREDIALSQAKQDSVNVAIHINRELIILKTVVDRTANELTNGKLNKESILDYLQHTMVQTPIIFTFGLAYHHESDDPSSELYSPSYRRDIDGLFELKHIEYDYTDSSDSRTEWYYNTIEQGTYWGEPYLGSVSKSMVTTYFAPFYRTDSSTSKNEIAGVIYASISLNDIDKLVKSLDIGEEGYSYILSEEGQFLTYPDESITSGSIFDLAEKLDDEIWRKDGQQVINNHPGQPFFRKGFDKKTEHNTWVFYEPIPSTGWTVGVVMDKYFRIIAPNTIKRYFIRATLAIILSLFFLSIILFKAYHGTTSSLWGVSITISILLVVGVRTIWYLEIAYPPRDSGQVVLMNWATVDKELAKIDQAFMDEGLPLPVRIPTGIMLETITFGSANENAVSGYIWQKYPISLSDDIIKKPILTDFLTPDGIYMEELYRFVEDDYEVIGWLFEGNLRQEPSVDKYPLDEATVQVQIWPHAFDENFVLVPDLNEYEMMNPSSLPGMSSVLVLENWSQKRAFFSYRFDKYNTTFGSRRTIKKFHIPDLYYNVIIRRQILSPLTTHGITLLVVTALMFAVMSVHAESSFNVLSYAAALFFVIVLSHVELRDELQTAKMVYLEYGYIGMYLLLLIVSLNSMLFYSEINIKIIKYKDNLIPKLMYWPVVITGFLLITLMFFYPEHDPTETIEAIKAAHSSMHAP